jgi:hypothetical protein
VHLSSEHQRACSGPIFRSTARNSEWATVGLGTALAVSTCRADFDESESAPRHAAVPGPVLVFQAPQKAADPEALAAAHFAPRSLCAALGVSVDLSHLR